MTIELTQLLIYLGFMMGGFIIGTAAGDRRGYQRSQEEQRKRDEHRVLWEQAQRFMEHYRNQKKEDEDE
jgi:hypothetical protein